MVRPLPQMPASLPLPDALSRLRRSNSHLALVTGDDGSVTAMVALEDLVEDLVGTVRDGHTVAEIGARRGRVDGPTSGHTGTRVRRVPRAAPASRAGR